MTNMPENRINESRSRVRSAKLEQVIIVRSAFGEGTRDDPVRILVEVFAADGSLIAKHDMLGDSIGCGVED